MKTPLAVGRVESLCINGNPVESILFGLDGPTNDTHAGYHRALSGHDGEYISTSALTKGSPVLNVRSWSGLSLEDVRAVEKILGVSIPAGCLLENIIVSGIPNFSQLAPTSRLVFDQQPDSTQQAIVAVWEENTPCSVVGRRLALHHLQADLCGKFITAAKHRRGVVGLVYAPGLVKVGDTVRLFPPVQ